MTRHLGPARDEPTFAFAGIGHPESFFEALRQDRWSIVGTMAFPDHRSYSVGDVTRLKESAVRAAARVLVTTEKDVVRLGRRASVSSEVPIVAVPMHVTIEPAGEFASLLERAAGGGRA
jgi:tetraacyldisaccharide 4'-kinase